MQAHSSVTFSEQVTPAAHRITVRAADAGDWIKYTQTVTRDSAVSPFTGRVSATNLTDGVDQGTAASSRIQSTADGFWGGAMCPSFRTLRNAQETAMQVNRWVVTTLTLKP